MTTRNLRSIFIGLGLAILPAIAAAQQQQGTPAAKVSAKTIKMEKPARNDTLTFSSGGCTADTRSMRVSFPLYPEDHKPWGKSDSIAAQKIVDSLSPGFIATVTTDQMRYYLPPDDAMSAGAKTFKAKYGMDENGKFYRRQYSDPLLNEFQKISDGILKAMKKKTGRDFSFRRSVLGEPENRCEP